MNTFWIIVLGTCLDIVLLGAIIVLSVTLGEIKIELNAIRSKLDKKLM